MLAHPNILHVILALAGAGCLYTALLETRQRAIRRGRLFLPPFLAFVVAALTALAQLAQGQPSWMFAAALGIGLAIGGVRGFTIPLKTDQYWSLVQVRRTSKRALPWVAAVVTAAAALECGAALAGLPLEMWRLLAALAAVACTAMLWARAVVMVARMHYAPHVDL